MEKLNHIYHTNIQNPLPPPPPPDSVEDQEFTKNYWNEYLDADNKPRERGMQPGEKWTNEMLVVLQRLMFEVKSRELFGFLFPSCPHLFIYSTVRSQVGLFFSKLGFQARLPHTKSAP